MSRVTPIFEGNNLVAKGIKMEGYSVEIKAKELALMFFAIMFNRV